ncbi:MAG TPA: CHAD domain-containing protein [Thermoanaerobaculia bacterium]|nr:CHAD domain-containing protein [Thermoanaerobaculia bacterium]
MSLPAALLSLSPEEGARRLALDFLDQAAAARERLHDPADAEALHDFRVALRRLRSTLRSYRPYLEESLPKKLRRRIRDLARSTGPGRDIEVQLEWLRERSRHLAGHHRAGLAWITGRLEEQMREAYSGMIEQLPEEFPDIEKDLRQRLSVYRTEVHLDAETERPTFAAATAGILRRQALELESHLARVDSVEDEEEAHEARIVAKRVRYLLEPLVGQSRDLPEADAIVKRLKGLQDLLGELHDAHVLETELAAAVETAAAERARRILELSLSYMPDDNLLRVERRRSRESGLIALTRLNRARRDRLFSETEKEWLDGRAGDLLGRLEALAESMSGLPAHQEEDPGEDRQE